MNSFGEGVAATLVGLAFLFIFCGIAYEAGQKDIRREAVEHKLAHFETSSDQKIQFVWNEQYDPDTECR